MSYGGVHPAADVPVRWVMPKHVWVNVSGGAGDRRPGILLAWRQVPGPSADQTSWEAYVVEASWHPGLGQRLQVDVSQGWHMSHHVRPVE